MLAALTKCEDSLNVDPPSSEILYSSNINSSTIDSEEGVASKKPRGLNQNHNHRTKEPLYVSSSGTAVSCMPSFSGLPRFSFNIDQELSDDRLTIVKKNLQLQTLQRRLTYLAEFYYRELIGTISWAKDLPGKKSRYLIIAVHSVHFVIINVILKSVFFYFFQNIVIYL